MIQREHLESELVIEFRQWSLNYRSNLEVLLNDLYLINQRNYEIYFAIDFYDIFEFCFPLIGILNRGLWDLWNNDIMRRGFLNKQISRSLLFLLSEMYSGHILLLPPHLRECNDFFRRLSNHVGVYAAKDKQNELLNYISSDISRELKIVNGEDDLEKVLNMLNNKSPELLYFFSNNLNKGINALVSLIKEDYVTPRIELLPKDEESRIIAKRIYEQIAIEIQHDGNNLLEQALKEARNVEEKEFQNRRDAEALRYIKDLNEKWKDRNEKKLIFLVSSAKHMKRLEINSRKKGSSLSEKGIELEIENIKFDALRDLDYFHLVGLEISKFCGGKNKKLDMKHVDLKKFENTARDDAIKIDNFLNQDSDLATIGKRFWEPIIENNLREAIKLNEAIGNTDLSFHIESFMPATDSSNASVDINYDYFKTDMLQTVSCIQDSLNKGEFKTKIFDRSVELEKERLTYFWPLVLGNLPNYCRERKTDIILFSLPFEINITHKESSEIVSEFKELNINARIEIKKDFDISEKTIDGIYLQLKRLSETASNVEGDEKYILWFMIFLCLGRHDLIDYWYTHFVYERNTSHQAKRELSYIYAINFIKEMRKFGKKSKKDYEDLIALCDQFAESVNTLQIECDINCTNLNQIMAQLETQGILRPLDIECIKLECGYLAISGIVSNVQYIYIIKKAKNKITITRCDLRFIHLRNAIYNRYLLDYKNFDGSNFLDLQYKFKDIYIPISKKFQPEYSIAIIADYSYLLALNENSRDFENNLLEAKKMMLEIEKDSLSPYWNYSKYFILGYIFYELAYRFSPSKTKENARKARNYFHKSMKELPFVAKNLSKMLLDKIELCDDILEI